MLSLIVGLVIAGIAGWLAGNIMKTQPFLIAGSPMLANVILGILGGVVGQSMLWVIGLSASGIVGRLVAAVLGAIVVIYVVGQLKKS